jgi:hypothetical protein
MGSRQSRTRPRALAAGGLGLHGIGVTAPRLLDVSTAEWPLVVTIVRDGYTLDDIHAMNEAFEAMFARRERFAAVTDARGIHTIPSSAGRQLITQWNRAHEAQIRRWNVAGSIVIDSIVARATLRAIHWVAPHPTPYAVVETLDEARAFCFAELERVSVA